MELAHEVFCESRRNFTHRKSISPRTRSDDDEDCPLCVHVSRTLFVDNSRGPQQCCECRIGHRLPFVEHCFEYRILARALAEDYLDYERDKCYPQSVAPCFNIALYELSFPTFSPLNFYRKHTHAHWVCFYFWGVDNYHLHHLHFMISS